MGPVASSDVLSVSMTSVAVVNTVPAAGLTSSAGSAGAAAPACAELPARCQPHAHEPAGGAGGGRGNWVSCETARVLAKALKTHMCATCSASVPCIPPSSYPLPHDVWFEARYLYGMVCVWHKATRIQALHKIQPGMLHFARYIVSPLPQPGTTDTGPRAGAPCRSS